MGDLGDVANGWEGYTDYAVPPPAPLEKKKKKKNKPVDAKEETKEEPVETEEERLKRERELAEVKARAEKASREWKQKQREKQLQKQKIATPATGLAAMLSRIKKSKKKQAVSTNQSSTIDNVRKNSGDTEEGKATSGTVQESGSSKEQHTEPRFRKGEMVLYKGVMARIEGVHHESESYTLDCGGGRNPNVPFGYPKLKPLKRSKTRTANIDLSNNSSTANPAADGNTFNVKATRNLTRTPNTVSKTSISVEKPPANTKSSESGAASTRDKEERELPEIGPSLPPPGKSRDGLRVKVGQDPVAKKITPSRRAKFLPAVPLFSAPAKVAKVASATNSNDLAAASNSDVNTSGNNINKFPVRILTSRPSPLDTSHEAYSSINAVSGSKDIANRRKASSMTTNTARRKLLSEDNASADNKRRDGGRMRMDEESNDYDSDRTSRVSRDRRLEDDRSRFRRERDRERDKESRGSSRDYRRDRDNVPSSSFSASTSSRDTYRERDRRDIGRDRDRRRRRGDGENRATKWNKEMDEKWCKQAIKLKEMQPITTVYLWELDEALIPFQSLLDEELSRELKLNPEIKNVGFSVDRTLAYLLNQRLWWRELERHDQPHVNTLLPFDDQRPVSAYKIQRERLLERGRPSYAAIARRYRWLKQAYEKPTEPEGLTTILAEKSHRIVEDLYQVNQLSDRWLEATRDTLIAIHNSGGVNLVVAGDKLIPCLTKLFLFRLNKIFPSEMVYASAKMGKAWCFEQIVKHYGANTRYIAVGGNSTVLTNLKVAAKNGKWIKIESAESLRRLTNQVSSGDILRL